MVWNRFASCYYQPVYREWVAWDPEIEHRSKKDAEEGEIVDIEGNAHQYTVPQDIGNALDRLITQEIYQLLIANKLDEENILSHGFRILKNADTRVLEHHELPGWLIKIGTEETRSLLMEGGVKMLKNKNDALFSIRHTNLLRAAGREYFVHQIKNLDPKDQKFFEFPEEYLYQCPNAPAGTPIHKKYFSISQKKNIYSGTETLEILRSQKESVQRLVAKKLIDFIKKTRLTDLNVSNLVLSKEKKYWCFVMIDTEPLGILLDSQDNGANLLNAHEHVLLGLISFRDFYCLHNGLTAMAEEIDLAIQERQQFKPIRQEQRLTVPAPATPGQYVRLIALIIISIICPLIPLIVLISALIVSCCAQQRNSAQLQ